MDGWPTADSAHNGIVGKTGDRCNEFPAIYRPNADGRISSDGTEMNLPASGSRGRAFGENGVSVAWCRFSCSGGEAVDRRWSHSGVEVESR